MRMYILFPQYISIACRTKNQNFSIDLDQHHQRIIEIRAGFPFRKQLPNKEKEKETKDKLSISNEVRK